MNNIKSILSLAMLAVLASAIVPMSAFAQEPEQTSEEQQPEEFTVQVTAGEDTITRGSKQSINVETDQPAEITGSITYASSFTRAFFGTTGDDNSLTYEWKIGANSKPGTFAVKVIAISLDNQAATDQTTFTVTSAPALPPDEQEQPEVPVGNGTGPVVDNGTITEGGNGTVIVPEEPININITLPADNQTGGGNITIPSYNDTIPIPIPINDTSQNETIPIEIPVDPNTNQTVPLPELPTNETVPVSNETAPPVENVTQPGGENDTIIVTPDNETIPIDNGTIIVTEPPAGNVTEPEPLPQPPTNQTEELPDEIPINGTVGNVTEPIELPINSTTGNETIPIPPIDVEIPDNATLPSQNVTEPEQPPASNVTSPEVVSDIIAELQDRTTALENQSATRQEVIESVGTAIEQIGNAVSIVPGLTEDEQSAVVQSVNEVMQAIKGLG